MACEKCDVSLKLSPLFPRVPSEGKLRRSLDPLNSTSVLQVRMSPTPFWSPTCFLLSETGQSSVCRGRSTHQGLLGAPSLWVGAVRGPGAPLGSESRKPPTLAIRPNPQAKGPEPQARRMPRSEGLQESGVPLGKQDPGEETRAGWAPLCAFPRTPLLALCLFLRTGEKTGRGRNSSEDHTLSVPGSPHVQETRRELGVRWCSPGARPRPCLPTHRFTSPSPPS